MTPKNIMTIGFSEIKEVQITCACKTSFMLPVPVDFKLVSHVQHCLGCGAELWSGQNDQRLLHVFTLTEAINGWRKLATKNFDLTFVLDQPVLRA